MVNGTYTVESGVQAQPGQTVTIRVNFDGGGDEIASYQFTMSYDPNILQPVADEDFVTDSDAPVGTQGSAPDGGGVSVNGFDTQNIGDSFYWDLEFDVVGSRDTSTNITFTDADTSASNVSGQQFTLTLNDGSFEVPPIIQIASDGRDTDSASESVDRYREANTGADDRGRGDLTNPLDRFRSLEQAGVRDRDQFAFPLTRKRDAAIDSKTADRGAVDSLGRYRPVDANALDTSLGRAFVLPIELAPSSVDGENELSMVVSRNRSVTSFGTDLATTVATDVDRVEIVDPVSADVDRLVPQLVRKRDVDTIASELDRSITVSHRLRQLNLLVGDTDNSTYATGKSIILNPDISLDTGKSAATVGKIQSVSVEAVDRTQSLTAVDIGKLPIQVDVGDKSRSVVATVDNQIEIGVESAARDSSSYPVPIPVRLESADVGVGEETIDLIAYDPLIGTVGERLDEEDE